MAECYALGLDPADATNDFRIVSIELVDGASGGRALPLGSQCLMSYPLTSLVSCLMSARQFPLRQRRVQRAVKRKAIDSRLTFQT